MRGDAGAEIFSEQDNLVSSTPAALFAIDLNGTVLAHNEALGEWFGVAEPGALVGQNIVQWLPPSSRLMYETQMMPRLLELGQLREVMFEVIDGDGARRTVLIQARVHRRADGSRVVAVAGVDSSTRSSFERELVDARRSAELAHRRLALLQEATSALAVARGLDDLGEALVAAVGKATAAAWTQVRIVKDAKARDAVRTWGSSPPGVSIPDAICERAEPLVCRDPSRISSMLPDEASALRRATVEALLVIPIARVTSEATAVIGEIRCWFRRPRTLDADELDTLTALGAQAERVVEHLRLAERLRHHAMHDSLTGLPNRFLFEQKLDDLLAAHLHAEERSAVLFIDLDGFKEINDERGHDVGDDVLQTVATRIAGVIRQSDNIARLGGDEFLVAVGGMADTAIRALADRILDAVRRPLDGAAQGSAVSASIGVMSWGAADRDRLPSAGGLLAAADAAMYEAKRSGKDGVRFSVWEG